MIDSPTLKALASTIATFAVIVAIGAFTSAIGQDTAPRATAPAASPYENVDAEANTAIHNRPDRPAPSTEAVHNTP
ncbi:MAG: hypothetical protein BRD42_04880 [Bacteroidetes bacterium QS_3_64_15]|nr:MAG: hypothetical protein BRD42_04880 [Bacteroidetes bacterium QS_3_64_15]